MEIGQQLRQARENRGLTLEDVENETRIRRKYLQAMEEEQFQVLPGAVYAKAFLKTYAGFLGLDAADAVETYNRNFAGKAAPEAPGKLPAGEPAVARTATRRISMRSARSSGYAKRNYLLWLAAVAVVAGLVALGVYLDKTTLGRPLAPGSLSSVPQQSLEEQSSPEQSPLPAGAAAVDLELTVSNGDCWMLVTVDGATAFEGTLTPGQSKRFEGQEQVLVKMGNAGAVTARLNGQDLGVLGSPGQVESREFRASP
ncbi:MAG: Helix-turn-helix domain protein [Pelotomaculum sp. PtaB.Bin104]|nr:MAG: Helix-turn-helix domain protein [Pelotomaculum sp. PtaB.Bin104]